MIAYCFSYFFHTKVRLIFFIFSPLFCKEELGGDFNDIKFTTEVDVTSAKSLLTPLC
ncbi:hypothetical protein HMPREF9065_01390 [Aggregatibacter sp. oral taxon 458 str. W10330]|nr:hypothetical protein HMPREF9065_01390 [Aggregatibacter sp. oral taxon 458 str. W10330]